MSMISDELFRTSERLDSIASEFDLPEIKKPLDDLIEAVNRASRSWSGSWLGYHSRVYYRNLEPSPPGARFSQEWGLIKAAFMFDTIGDWVEYDYEDARRIIYDIAGTPDLTTAERLADKARNAFQEDRGEIISLLTTVQEQRDDTFLAMLRKEAEDLSTLTSSHFINYYRPSGSFMSRDTVAVGQGLHTPPHIAVLAGVMAIRHPAKACEDLSKVAKRAASHLAKRERYAQRNQEIGTNVFIGHGLSIIWKDLKDFIQDRLGLPWDEFNRVPVAGITNIARLSEMLDDAAIAFIVMTAEDEQADGKLHARMNVIHEAGLFQGRLSFTKAILLLEEGCEEFSNIHGLGQIRFPRGNIKAIFEEIRQVLEREGLVHS
jgi:predicted nucleotide-binding protein